MLVEKTKMTNESHIHLNNHIYQRSSSNYPNDYRGVKWESAELQFLRFKILCEVSPLLLSSSILDVGSGLGHLIEYLNSQNYTGHYKGIDLCSQMVQLAKKKYPQYIFENNDLDGIENKSVDFLLASGIFAFIDYTQSQLIIQQLFSKAIKGVAFNCLSAYEPENAKKNGLFYPNPNDIFNICKSITPYVTLRHDYLQNDFTIYMYT